MKSKAYRRYTLYLLLFTLYGVRNAAAVEVSTSIPSLSFPATDQATFVEPESVPPVVTVPSVPPEAPAGLRLPEAVVKADEWRGVQCGVTQPRFAIFRHAEKWRAFWEKGLAPYSRRLHQCPVIDFDKTLVVGVFLGEKRYPNYEVLITSITPEKTGNLVVRYREIKRMEGVFNPPFTIQPFHLKKIPLFNGDIRFVKVSR